MECTGWAPNTGIGIEYELLGLIEVLVSRETRTVRIDSFEHARVSWSEPLLPAEQRSWTLAMTISSSRAHSWTLQRNAVRRRNNLVHPSHLGTPSPFRRVRVGSHPSSPLDGDQVAAKFLSSSLDIMRTSAIGNLPWRQLLCFSFCHFRCLSRNQNDTDSKSWILRSIAWIANPDNRTLWSGGMLPIRWILWRTRFVSGCGRHASQGLL